MSLLTDDQMDGPLSMSRYYTDLSPGKPILALYEITADRFLIVLNDLAGIRHLKYILSSRYHLHIVRVDTADNYVDGMISNMNCDEWSLWNLDDIKFSMPMSEKIIEAEVLCATREVASYNVFNEKLWCLFCSYCLQLLTKDFTRFKDDPTLQDYAKLDNFLNRFLDVSEVNAACVMITPEVRNKVLKFLYLGRDLSATEAEIKKLIGFL